MTLRQHQEAFARDTVKLYEYIWGNGYTFTYGEAWRHEVMQNWYVENGYSKTMNSKHRQRLAIDINVFSPEGAYITRKDLLQHIGDYWESLSPENKWGGNFEGFEDTPHFERSV